MVSSSSTYYWRVSVIIARNVNYQCPALVLREEGRAVSDTPWQSTGNAGHSRSSHYKIMQASLKSYLSFFVSTRNMEQTNELTKINNINLDIRLQV